jgi:hypothetical protein
MKRTLAAATLLAIGVATAAPSYALDSPSGSTTVTFRVSGCEGCVIQGITTRSGATDSYNGPRAKVRNGVATMTVPTAQTAGMTFSLDAAWKVEINAQPFIAFQYKGAAPGGAVTKAAGQSARRASPCWSGTTDGTATLRVKVRKVLQPAFAPGDSGSPRKTPVPMAWVVPTQDAPPPFWPVYDGVLAAQDVALCAVG